MLPPGHAALDEADVLVQPQDLEAFGDATPVLAGGAVHVAVGADFDVTLRGPVARVYAAEMDSNFS